MASNASAASSENGGFRCIWTNALNASAFRGNDCKKPSILALEWEKSNGGGPESAGREIATGGVAFVSRGFRDLDISLFVSPWPCACRRPGGYAATSAYAAADPN